MGLDVLAFLEIGVVGTFHATDRAASERLADGEGRGVGLAVDHAAPHVGIDRHADVPDQYFAGTWAWHLHFADFKVLGLRHADRAASEYDFP